MNDHKSSLLFRAVERLSDGRLSMAWLAEQSEKRELVPLADFARGLRRSEPLAALLARDLELGIVTDSGGNLVVDVAPLNAILSLITEVEKLGPNRRIARAQAAREVRDGLVRRLTEAGLRYQDSAFERGALLRFAREDGTQVGIMSYVATTLNRAGQTTFCVGHLDDDSVDWVLLVATQLGRTDARTRGELKAMSADGKGIGLTVRPGTRTDDLLENRLEEIVSGKVRERPPLPARDVWRRSPRRTRKEVHK
jgi:hypothetical protein